MSGWAGRTRLILLHIVFIYFVVPAAGFTVRATLDPIRSELYLHVVCPCYYKILLLINFYDN